MAEEAPNELGAARAEYKALVGKNPSPRLNAEALRAKIAEIQAAPPAEPVDGATPKAEKPAKPEKPAKAEKAEKADPGDIPHGTALLDHEDPDAGASFNGIELARGKKGLFLVPLSAVEHLVPHGFRLIGAGE